MVSVSYELNLRVTELPFDFDDVNGIRQAFRWKNVSELEPTDVTFLTDKTAIENFKLRWKS